MEICAIFQIMELKCVIVFVNKFEVGVLLLTVTGSLLSLHGDLVEMQIVGYLCAPCAPSFCAPNDGNLIEK
jgi:hypothetical protein